MDKSCSIIHHCCSYVFLFITVRTHKSAKKYTSTFFCLSPGLYRAEESYEQCLAFLENNTGLRITSAYLVPIKDTEKLRFCEASNERYYLEISGEKSTAKGCILMSPLFPKPHPHKCIFSNFHAEKQLCRKCLGGPGGHAEQESDTCPSHKEGESLGLHWEQRCQQVKQDDPFPLLSTGEATPEMLGLALGSPELERHELLEDVQQRGTKMMSISPVRSYLNQLTVHFSCTHWGRNSVAYALPFAFYKKNLIKKNKNTFYC